MAPKKTKKGVDNLRKLKKECEQKRRDRIKNNPQLYEEAKRRERERYHRRKEEGKIKKITDLTSREQRSQRKKWVEKTARSRSKKKQEEQDDQTLRNNQHTPPESEEEVGDALPINQPELGRAGTSREESGKKVARRKKAKAYREIARLKKELEKEKKAKIKVQKSKEKYKKRLFRLKEKNKNPKSPCQKVSSEILQGERVSPRVRRFLEFGTALTTQIEENYEKNKNSRRSKIAFGLVLSGKIIKKYRSLHKIPVKGYWKKLNKLDAKGCVLDSMLKNKELTTYKTKNQLKIKIDVSRFFEQDDVSRLEPGIKDTKTKHKVKKQIRTLAGNLKTLHKKFEAENGYNIPYSTFCSFRPFWVLLPDVKKRDTCACEKHENMSLVFEKLKMLKVLKYSDLDEMIKSLCCKDSAKTREECLERKCKKCFHLSVEIETFENSVTSIEQWKRKDVKYFIKGEEKTTKKVVKEKFEIEIKSLVEMLYGLILPFMQHICNIMHQYKSVKELKHNMKADEVLIHVDFSQNYECKYAKEIQSVHFGGSRQQVTLHTGVMYYKDDDGEIRHVSFCSLSESLRHDSSAIAAHLNCILNHAKSLKGNLKSIHFLSDSPTTQYRNKTMFYLILKHLTKFCSESISWNFSECGHGKGAPDGIGGYLKRTANRTVAEGQDIPTFDIFYEVLSKKCETVELFLVKKEDIEEIDGLLLKNIPTFKGTMKVRQVVWESPKKVLEMRRLSCFTCGAKKCSHYFTGTYIPNPTEQQETSNVLSCSRLRFDDVYTDDDDEEDTTEIKMKVELNDYIITKFYGKKTVHHYIGLVTDKDGDELYVKFLKKSAGFLFIFPEKDDSCYVNMVDVVAKLNQPSINNRQQYKFLLPTNIAKLL